MQFKFKSGLLLVCAALLISYPASAEREILTAEQIVHQANADRERYGLPTLQVSQTLSQAALAKAQDMLSNNYFAHVSPNGTKPWFWFSSMGYNYSFAGENLAVGYSDAAELQSSWMASPKHRANLLSPQYTEIGIGIVYRSEQPIVVQFFGSEAGQLLARQ